MSLTHLRFRVPPFAHAAPTQAPMSRAVAPNMVVESVDSEAVVSAVSAASALVAANAGDFGGYTIPVIGLGLLGAIIGILAGPVED